MEAFLDDDFYNWAEKNEDKWEKLENADDLLWYYNYEDLLNWVKCEENNLITKYDKRI